MVRHIYNPISKGAMCGQVNPLFWEPVAWAHLANCSECKRQFEIKRNELEQFKFESRTQFHQEVW